MSWKTKAERSFRGHKIAARLSWPAAIVAGFAFWDKAYPVALWAAGAFIGLRLASQLLADLFCQHFDNAATSRTAAGISGKWDPDEVAAFRNGRR